MLTVEEVGEIFAEFERIKQKKGGNEDGSAEDLRVSQLIISFFNRLINSKCA